MAALRKRLEKDIREKLLTAKHRLTKTSPARFLITYQHRLQNSRLQIVNLQDRMFTALERLLSLNRFKLQRNAEKIQNLGPTNVLKRGFSIVRKFNGEVIRQPAQCKAGEILEVLLAEGKLTVKVENTSATWNKDDKQNEQNTDVYNNIVYNDSVYKNKENQ